VRDLVRLRERGSGVNHCYFMNRVSDVKELRLVEHIVKNCIFRFRILLINLIKIIIK
jgi:hypothetical protein